MKNKNSYRVLFKNQFVCYLRLMIFVFPAHDNFFK